MSTLRTVASVVLFGFLVAAGSANAVGQGVTGEVKTLSPADGAEFEKGTVIEVTGTAEASNDGMEDVGVRLHIRVLYTTPWGAVIEKLLLNKANKPGDPPVHLGVRSILLEAGDKDKKLSFQNAFLMDGGVGSYQVIGQLYQYEVDDNGNWSNPTKLGGEKVHDFSIVAPDNDDQNPGPLPKNPAGNF